MTAAVSNDRDGTVLRFWFLFLSVLQTVLLWHTKTGKQVRNKTTVQNMEKSVKYKMCQLPIKTILKSLDINLNTKQFRIELMCDCSALIFQMCRYIIG